MNSAQPWKKKTKEIISIIASTCSSYPVLDLNNLKFGFSIFTVSSRRCMVTIFVGTDDATATIGQTESSSEITLYRMQPKLRADGSTLVNAGDPEAELGSPDDLGNVARGLQVEELGHLKVDRDSLDHCIIHYHVLAAFVPNFKMIYDDQRNMHNITYKKRKKGEKMRMVFRLRASLRSISFSTHSSKATIYTGAHSQCRKRPPPGQSDPLEPYAKTVKRENSTSERASV